MGKDDRVCLGVRQAKTSPAISFDAAPLAVAARFSIRRYFPSNTIAGGSISASNAFAVLTKPRCASWPL